jgi:hypothetical protein
MRLLPHEPAVSLAAVEEGLELAVGFKAPVFPDPEKNNPVDGLLDRKIQFPLAQVGVAEGEVPGQQLTPALDLRQEGGVNLGGTFF